MVWNEDFFSDDDDDVDDYDVDDDTKKGFKTGDGNNLGI